MPPPQVVKVINHTGLWDIVLSLWVLLAKIASMTWSLRIHTFSPTWLCLIFLQTNWNFLKNYLITVLWSTATSLFTQQMFLVASTSLCLHSNSEYKKWKKLHGWESTEFNRTEFGQKLIHIQKTDKSYFRINFGFVFVLLYYASFFTPMLTSGLSLSSKWHQISSGLQDSSQYSSQSQQCYSLEGLNSSDFQFLFPISL